MAILITAVLLGVGFALLATQNTTGVTLRAGAYGLMNVPLYLVVLGSFLIGLFLAWLFNGIGWVSSFLTMKGKDKKIHQTESEISQLQEKIHELEEENLKLRERLHESEGDLTPKRPLLERLRHSPAA